MRPLRPLLSVQRLGGLHPGRSSSEALLRRPSTSTLVSFVSPASTTPWMDRSPYLVSCVPLSSLFSSLSLRFVSHHCYSTCYMASRLYYSHSFCGYVSVRQQPSPTSLDMSTHPPSTSQRLAIAQLHCMTPFSPPHAPATRPNGAGCPWPQKCPSIRGVHIPQQVRKLAQRSISIPPP